MSKFNTKLDSSNKVDSSAIVNSSITINEECFRKTADLAKEEQLTADAEHYTYEKDQEFYRDRKKIEDYLTKKIENDKYVFPGVNNSYGEFVKMSRIIDPVNTDQSSPGKRLHFMELKFKNVCVRAYVAVNEPKHNENFSFDAERELRIADANIFIGVFKDDLVKDIYTLYLIKVDALQELLKNAKVHDGKDGKYKLINKKYFNIIPLSGHIVEEKEEFEKTVTVSSTNNANSLFN